MYDKKTFLEWSVPYTLKQYSGKTREKFMQWCKENRKKPYVCVVEWVEGTNERKLGFVEL
jgi:hypothetical protein